MIKFITRLLWAAFIGFIVFLILFVVMQAQLEYMKNSGGVILASELLSYNYLPIFIGGLVFIYILFLKEEK